MPWIKRNLFFVISAAIGLILMAAAGFFLWSNMQANAQAGEELKNVIGELTSLRQQGTPSEEMIQAAIADQQRARAFLDQARKLFSPFPEPPKLDERSFRVYLNKAISRLQTDAANSGVGLPEQYAFSFGAIYSANNERLNFSQDSIQPWMAQMQEIQAICDVLFRSKISFLEAIRRVPVSKDDEGTSDYIPTASVTNELGVVTPYEITFRGFSADLASVMDGFLRATNCYMIRNVNVIPSSAPLIVDTVASPYPAAPVYVPQPTPQPARARSAPPAGIEDPGLYAPAAPAQAPRPAAMPVYRMPAAATGPQTILAERPLQITILLDVIKLKAAEQ